MAEIQGNGKKVLTRVRMGMVGGGATGFIGAVHRMAAALTGKIDLVCGAFSSDATASQAFGESLHLPKTRCYKDYTAMIEGESSLAPYERMQFVAIATPNHLHFPVATAALEANFHVLSDKPATLTVAESISLRQTIVETGQLYGLTHVYTGYPLVKEARTRVQAGALGRIRKVVVEYSQGWMSEAIELQPGSRNSWRFDPNRAGQSGCMADIGVHAANLAEYIVGSHITQVCADLTTVVDGRLLDDDGTALLRFQCGARGVLMASQISVGEENGLAIRVYGDLGGLEWRQQEPNTLWLRWKDRPTEMVRSGASYLDPRTLAHTRLPMGHPEGFIEAFANLYGAFAEQILAHESGTEPSAYARDCPGIEDAISGMAFIESVVAASDSERMWHEVVRHREPIEYAQKRSRDQQTAKDDGSHRNGFA